MLHVYSDMELAPNLATQQQTWSDDEVIRRVLEGDTPAYELLVRRYNQRVYRIIRSILRDDSEAEDVMQEAYVRAYQHLAKFEGRSSFATWLGRIAIHEALARAERSRRFEPIDLPPDSTGGVTLQDLGMSPEEKAANSEARTLLERAILALPVQYRTALVLRDVDEMSTAEAAATLEISEEALKVRLHRARAMLRKELYAISGATSSTAFQFHATRCDRVAKIVLERIAGSDGTSR
jgi:RNA polymerase sigma-70 factor (ECF subfamily)